MTSYNKNRTGFTLGEVIITVLLIAIIAISALSFSVFMMSLVKREQNKLVAYNLASAQLDYLKYVASGNFQDDMLTAGTDKLFTTSLGVTVPQGYIVTYDVRDNASPVYCKAIRARCNYAAAGIDAYAVGFVVDK